MVVGSQSVSKSNVSSNTMTDSNANSDKKSQEKSHKSVVSDGGNLNTSMDTSSSPILPTSSTVSSSTISSSVTSSSTTSSSVMSTPSNPGSGVVDATANASTGSETIYELGHRSPLDSPSHVVSERVQTLASQIYNELQKIMSRCSDDEEAVSGLMPLVVNVLESLDLTMIENQQLQVELELCKDDNEQLVQAFEKEKMVKKKVDQRLIELEFQSEEEKQGLQSKIDSLENIVKMLELKAKNSTDHSTRLEEKEAESKGEYNKLHSRYTELLRSHCDLMERVKILIGSDVLVGGDTSSGPSSIQTSLALRNFLAKKNEMDERLENETRNDDIKGQRVGDYTSPVNPKVWLDTELSLEDASIIDDVEDIPRDKEPSSLGMEKEVENLIAENNELLATKNALNIVKDDLIAKVDELQSELTMVKDENHQLTAVKNRLRSRTSQLEEEVKKVKDEMEEVKMKLSQVKEDDEEGIPMVQRKRFTRLEMARVLMERNQYKEKLIELQEAVRWTELIRASKSEGEKKSAIWKFFSNLFTPSAATGTSPVVTSGGHPGITPGPSLRFSSSTPNSVTPALDAMRRRARAQQAGSGSSDLVMLMDSDLNSDRARALRNIRPHVNRSNGDRIQAYGWSIAATPGLDTSSCVSALKNTSVPVPTYCRPLSGDDVGMKIWCACAVDLSGGEAGFPGGQSDGEESSGPGSIDSRGRSETVTTLQNMSSVSVSNMSSVSVSSSMTESTETAIEVASDDDLDSLNHSNHLQSLDPVAALETELKLALSDQTEFIASEKSLSTFVWICSVSNSRSKVTIVNIRSNPSEVLDSFTVKTHLLCIASVPGAKDSDLVGTGDIDVGKVSGLSINKIDEVRVGKTGTLERTVKKRNEYSEHDKIDESRNGVEVSETLTAEDESNRKNVTDERLEKLTEYVKYMEESSLGSAGDDVATPTSPVYQSMSTCLPTIWLGGQNGILYIHSSIAQWSHCVASIKLNDSILAISHFRARIFVALANGTTCIFTRSSTSGEWNFNHYYVLDVGALLRAENPSVAGSSSAGSSVSDGKQMSVTSSIRCIEVSKGGYIWMGYRNLVLILDPKTLNVIHNLTIHPRKESQVRQLTALGDGVWCSLRLDSTLKLYSSHRPFNHLQDVDIEPYVSKMLSPKAFTFIRVTALKASGGRLWIGTANGVILSIPCDKLAPSSASSGTGSLGNEGMNQSSSVIVSSSGKDGSGRLQVSTFIPSVNSTGAQLSFHGHRDAVKFFVCTKNLVLSGGDGYIDFRINSDYDEDGADTMTMTATPSGSSSKTDKSHLIVWEITTPS